MMTTGPAEASADTAKRLVEPRQLLLMATGKSLPEALGLPPHTRLIDTPIRSAMTICYGHRLLQLAL